MDNGVKLNPIGGFEMGDAVQNETMKRDLPAADIISLPRGHNMNAVCCTHDCTLNCMSLCIPIGIPCGWLGACQTLAMREEAVVYKFNAPYAHLYVSPDKPDANIFCVNPCLQIKRYSLAPKTIDLPESKAAERDGSPVIVSGIVTWRIADPWKYLVSEDVDSFVSNQGLISMKEICSRFPYEATNDGEPSLRSAEHRGLVADALRSSLETRCERVGVHIENYEVRFRGVCMCGCGRRVLPMSC